MLEWMLSPALRRAGRLARDESGATALEFAILALPFFTLVFAILETSLIFFSGQILDSATQDASRLVRTGQAQAASFTVGNFRSAVCDRLYGLFDCNQLKINVAVVSDFTSATAPYPMQTGAECTTSGSTTTCDWKLGDQFQPGEGGQVVLVQVYYKWPTVIKLPGFNFQDQPDGTRLLGAVRVFRNEPFGCSGCT